MSATEMNPTVIGKVSVYGICGDGNGPCSSFIEITIKIIREISEASFVMNAALSYQ